MSRSKLGLLGLCAMVLGLMAISASAAQASKWLILNSGGIVKTGTELPASLGGELEPGTHATLLTTLFLIQTQLLCTTFTFNGLKLEGTGALTTGGKVKFTGCTVKLNGELNKECEPHSEGSPVGTIETLKLKGRLELIGTAGLTKIEPETGTTFVTVLMGAGCPIGNKVPINGGLVLEDCEGLLGTHLVKHLMKENAANSTFTVFGNKATIDGSAWVFLTGAHVNLLWGGDKD